MKNIKKTALTATAALLAIAGVAQAAPMELNIYGASAQYLYWNAQAQKYAQSLGCTAAAAVNNGGKHGFVSATACTSTLVPVNSLTGTRDLDIRYSGIASTEGILAVNGKAAIDTSLATGCTANSNQRLMYASSSTLVCKPVNVGTSDVAVDSLDQITSGRKLGPLGEVGTEIDVNLPSMDLSATGLTKKNTVIVPFGFFVNSAVTAQTCTSGLVGNYCTAASHCNTAPAATDGVCGAAATITNISREEAAMIFSGQATDWSDFGAYFTAKPIVACLRHAGSGTHAALDKTVMKSAWGANLVTAEVTDSIWFNQGSGDEMKCINGATTASPTGSLIGAIGYADADQAIGVAGTSQNVKQLKYNGFYPTRTAIRNGLYDFYSAASIYTKSTNGTTINNLANNMITYAQNPANVPTAKANYWAARSEMKYLRANDVDYPAYVGASSPQTP